jgi:hypothetical protein
MKRAITILIGLSLCVSAVAEPKLYTGEVIGKHIFGLAYDANQAPVKIENKALIFNESKFDKKVVLPHRRAVISGFGDAIGGLYLTYLDEEEERPVDTVSFSLGDIGGITRPRSGILTPWNSVLFSEAKAVDAARPDKFIEQYKPFYRGRAELVNPYNYGWVDEAIILQKQGKVKLIKNYAIGRVFASQLTMMPDGKTLYLFDKENYGLLYLFVSDKQGSLTSGTLYGVSLDDGKVTYEALGKRSALKMKFKLKRVTFNNLFESVTPQAGECPGDYNNINLLSENECLRLVRKNRKYAGIFEPARVFALKREGNAMSKFMQVTFGQGRVEMTTISGDKFSYTLSVNDGLDSQYIIQGDEK